jgi:nucleotide-binding universal stress UspA family protein
MRCSISAISRLAEGRSVTEALCRYAAAKHGVDLIVMGHMGTLPCDFFIGSNTTAMLEQRVPLLMLR